MRKYHVILSFLLLLSSSGLAQDDFFKKLSTAALELTRDKVVYDPSYYKIAYPNGDIPKGKGVCTDVVIRAYRKLGIDADVFGFCNTLAEKIASADFAVARSGAGTLFELAANRLPAFFIPYPFAAGNHQESNAAFLANKNCGFYKSESEANQDEILKIIFDNTLIAETSKNLEKVIHPDGATEIADFIIKNT